MNYMDWILNITILVILIIPIINGLRNGFVKTAFRLGRLVAAVAIAFAFCKRLGLWLKEKYIYSFLGERIHAFFDAETAQTAEELTDKIPNGIRNVLAMFGANVDELAAGAVAEGEARVAAFADRITEAAANILSVVIAFVALLLVAWLLLMLVGKLLDFIVRHLPALKQFNALLGGVLGLFLGLIAAWTGAQAIVALLGLVGHVDYTSAKLLAFFYESNPLGLLLKTVTTAIGTVAGI